MKRLSALHSLNHSPVPLDFRLQNSMELSKIDEVRKMKKTKKRRRRRRSLSTFYVSYK